MTASSSPGAGRASRPLLAVLLLLAVASFLRNGLWRESPNIWLDAIRKSPNKARTFACLGAEYEFKKMIPQAMEAYEQATRMRPDYFVVGAHVNLGLLYASQGAFDRAIEQYEMALRLDPTKAEAYNNIGNALIKRGDVFRALDYYHKAIQAQPGYVEAHFNIGLTYFEQGAREPARAALERTLQIKPDHQDARRLLALIPPRR